MVDKSDIFKNPVQELEQRTRSNLALAVEAVSGDIGADPLVVFPAQGKAERRADIEFDITNLTLEQEQAFRSAMGKLGPGRESNQTPAVVGLTSGFTALLEGHIITAISYNPLMLFLTIFLIIQLICTTLFKIKISLKAKVKEKHWILFFFIIAFIANWLYII